MKVAITGSSGFIGSHLTMKLLQNDNEILGIDNHNDYYDPKLKFSRLKRFEDHPNFTQSSINIDNKELLFESVLDFDPEIIINLAAQPGVRYSLENPQAYITSNIVGFFNILEVSREIDVEHLIFASSSSVYGANTNIPFKANSSIDHPLNLYAATKKSNESISHAYSHIYGTPITGLRFFTVYGPWGRPDMAPMIFIDKILKGEEITINNNGDHRRDFTYIDDIVSGIERVTETKPNPCENWNSFEPTPNSSSAPWKIYNLGRGKSIELLHFIEVVERELGLKAKKVFAPLQTGDMIETFAEMSEFENNFGKLEETDIESGIRELVKWFVDFYKI